MANSATGAPATLAWLFLSLSGRISRGVYWLAYVAISSVALAVIFQSNSAGAATLYGPATVIEPIVALGGLYANIALAWKRLHDCGKNGLYALILIVPVLLGVVMLLSGSFALLPVALLINLGATIWFGILPGTVGANRYGDSTNRPSS